VGYQRPTLKLIFTDPECDGLEVVARRMSVRSLVRMAALGQAGAPADRAQALPEIAETLVPLLLSWNLENHAGEPVPLTVDAMLDQDGAFVLAVMGALMDAAGGIPDPLAQPSSGGGPSPEASLPMEPSSPGPPSSRRPR
jgi:hypothetical protein